MSTKDNQNTGIDKLVTAGSLDKANARFPQIRRAEIKKLATIKKLMRIPHPTKVGR